MGDGSCILLAGLIRGFKEFAYFGEFPEYLMALHAFYPLAHVVPLPHAKHTKKIHHSPSSNSAFLNRSTLQFSFTARCNPSSKPVAASA